MTQKMILSLPVPAERRDALVEFLREALVDTRNAEGCLSAVIWLPHDDPARVLLFECWATREHHASYSAWRVETGFMDTLAPLVSAPPEVTWLQELPS